MTSPGKLDVDGLIEAVDADGLWWTQTADLGESTYGGESTLLAGAPQLADQLGGLDFLISPEAFFQTNTEMAEKLYGVALEYAALRGHERVFDLYSGIGTIALSMATRAREVIGLEIVEAAVADAIENARINEIQTASFFAGDARLALREMVERMGRPDVAVIDPPRAGLSQKIVRRVVEAAPSRIVYVSCNPTTLAPNAAQLVEAGYRLVKVRPVDMFPQTPHIECVALLEAGPGRRPQPGPRLVRSCVRVQARAVRLGLMRTAALALLALALFPAAAEASNGRWQLSPTGDPALWFSPINYGAHAPGTPEWRICPLNEACRSIGTERQVEPGETAPGTVFESSLRWPDGAQSGVAGPREAALAARDRRRPARRRRRRSDIGHVVGWLGRRAQRLVRLRLPRDRSHGLRAARPGVWNRHAAATRAPRGVVRLCRRVPVGS